MYTTEKSIRAHVHLDFTVKMQAKGFNLSASHPTHSKMGGSNPAQGVQFQPRRLKSSTGSSNPALEAQIQPLGLKSIPGGSNPTLVAQIQPWRLKSSPGSEPFSRPGRGFSHTHTLRFWFFKAFWVPKLHACMDLFRGQGEGLVIHTRSTLLITYMLKKLETATPVEETRPPALSIFNKK